MPLQRRAELILLLVTMFWGSSFALVKTALEDSSTVLFLALRFNLAVLTLLIFWRKPIADGILSDKLGIKAGIAAGLCLAAGYLFQTAGLRHTTPSKSAFLTSSCVAMVPLLGAVVYRVVPPPAELVGVGMAFIGMGTLSWPQQGFDWNTGDLLTVCGAFAYSAQILVVGRYAARVNYRILSLIQLATVAAIMLCCVWWAEPIVLRPSARLGFALVMTAFICTAVSFAVQAWAQRHTTPTRTGLIFATEPVSAAIISYLVYGEVLTGLVLAGAGLILAGVLVVELKPARLDSHPLS